MSRVPFTVNPASFYRTGRYMAAAVGGREFISRLPSLIGQKAEYKSTGVTKTKTMRRTLKKKKGGNKVATVASVKRMIQGTMETKQKKYAVSSVAVTSNTIYTYNLTAQITQGNTDGSRIGDEIFLSALTANFRYVTNVAAAYYTCRVILGYSGEEFNPSAGSFSTAGLTSGQIFVASPGGFAQGVVNTKAFTVIYDTMIQINSSITNIEEGHTIRFNPSLSGKFKFQEAGGIYGKTKNLYMIVCPEAKAASAPANAGELLLNAVLKYKDA